MRLRVFLLCVVFFLEECHADEKRFRIAQGGRAHDEDYEHFKSRQLSATLSSLFLAFSPAFAFKRASVSSKGNSNRVDQRSAGPLLKAGEVRIELFRQLPRKVNKNSIGQLAAKAFVLPADGSDVVSNAAVNAVQRDIVAPAAQEEVFVALDDNSVVGLCSVKVAGLACNIPKLGVEVRAQLANLVVAESNRKQGIGKKLCRAAESQAREWGFEEIFLIVEKDNTRAQKVYRKMDYRQVGVNKEAQRPKSERFGLSFVPTTQIVMRKDLVNPPLDKLLAPLAVIAAGGLLWQQGVADSLLASIQR